MRIAVVGGRLQGLEALYLAKQAGFKTLLIDKDPIAPAKTLADEFRCLDFPIQRDAANELLSSSDLILPATENPTTLRSLENTAHQSGIPIALDLEAFFISSSKAKTNELLSKADIPIPESWPECGFPVIMKPSNLSGSAGVLKVENQTRLQKERTDSKGEWVIQEYLEGPSYSLEVIADKNKAVCLQVTELAFDPGYDCKRVLAGPTIGRDLVDDFCELGKRIASAIPVTGIFDIEVISTSEGMKVLEIDARLPSQTPSAVYHSSGINMVGLLADFWVNGRLPEEQPPSTKNKAVIYEHLRLKHGALEICGEHIMADAQNLKLYRDWFSADAAISNVKGATDDWVATTIYVEDSETLVWDKRDRAIHEMKNAFRVQRFLDPVLDN